MSTADSIQKRSKRPIRKTLLQELFNLPNLLTLGRIAAIPFVCALMLQDTRVYAFIAALVYSVAALTDMVDGYLARKKQLVTLIGKFLDPLADKLIVLTILLTLLAMRRIPLWIVAIILAREITITGLRAIASSEGMVIDAKPLGKFKTAFQMVGLLGLVIHYTFGINLGFYVGDFNFRRIGMYFLLLSLFFSITSAFDYLYGFAKEMKRLRAKADPEDFEGDDTDDAES